MPAHRAAWSLQNKAGDIQRSLVSLNFSAAKMHAYEFGIRLGHAQRDLGVAMHGGQEATSESAALIRFDELLNEIHGELGRLMTCVVAENPQEALQSLAAISLLVASMAASRQDV